MRHALVSLSIVLLSSPIALAQRDSPVWHSYLPHTALFSERTTLDVELTYNKAGGFVEQGGHSQMYVLGYLEKDEQTILELAADEKLTAKAAMPEKMLLDLLVAERLATILATKRATSSDEAPVMCGPCPFAAPGGRPPCHRPA